MKSCVFIFQFVCLTHNFISFEGYKYKWWERNINKNWSSSYTIYVGLCFLIGVSSLTTLTIKILFLILPFWFGSLLDWVQKILFGFILPYVLIFLRILHPLICFLEKRSEWWWVMCIKYFTHYNVDSSFFFRTQHSIVAIN
jgi:hypothetical protein